MIWTDERIKLLRDRWQDGKTATQIAAELGPGFTRNAVLGKLHRLNIHERPKPPALPKPAKTPPPPRKPIMPALQKAPQKPWPKAEEPAIPTSERVTLDELTLRTCRWPMGNPRDDDFGYCGIPEANMLAEPVQPYCPYHARIAYAPAEDRRRAKRALSRVARSA